MAAPDLDQNNIEDVLGLNGPARKHGLRWLLIFGGLIVVAALIGGYFALFGNDADGSFKYVTRKVTRAELTVKVTATGTIQPINKVEVSSELSGIIRKVNVEANDRVKAGQVLAVLDTEKLKAQVAHGRATVASRMAKLVEAKATLIELRRKYERTKALAERGVASAQTLEAARAAYERAVASIASAQADVKVAKSTLHINELNLKKACICSPINGVVLERNVEPGQTVASSLQAPVLFRLAENLAKMQLEVDIDEADIGKVREGQMATFSVDAYPNRRFPAKITVIRFASQTVDGVVTYKAILTTDNTKLLLRPGMTATAEIVVAQVRNALLVPNAALRFTPPTSSKAGGRGILGGLIRRGPPRFRRPTSNKAADGSVRTLWLLRENAAVQVKVTIGASDGRSTQIVQGKLKPGEFVIVDTVTSRR